MEYQITLEYQIPDEVSKEDFGEELLDLFSQEVPHWKAVYHGYDRTGEILFSFKVPSMSIAHAKLAASCPWYGDFVPVVVNITEKAEL